MAVQRTEIQILQEQSEQGYRSRGQLSEGVLSLLLLSEILLCLGDLFGSAFCLPVSVAAGAVTVLSLQLAEGKPKLKEYLVRGWYLICLGLSAAGFSLVAQGFLESVNRVRELCNLKFYTEFLRLGNGTQVNTGSVLFWGILAVLFSLWILRQLKRRSAAGILLPAFAALLFALVFEQPDLRAAVILLVLLVIGLLLFYGAPGRKVRKRGAACCLFLLLAVFGIGSVSGTYRTSIRLEDWKKEAGLWLERMRYGEDTLPQGDIRKASGLLAEDGETLTLTMEQPKELYLRGYVGSTYKNGQWTLLQPQAYQGDYAGMLKWLKNQQFSAISQYGSYIRLTQAALETSIESEEVTVENTGASRKYVYLPATVSDWSAGFAKEQKDWQVRSSGLTGAREYRFEDSLGSQTADSVYPAEWLSRASDEAEQQYLDAEAVYHAFAEDSYLEIPSEYEAVMEEWFPEGFEGLDFEELTSRIRRGLRTSIQYVEQPREVPEGKDPLKWYLTEYQKGNAVCYASAAVLAFRAAGYPARYVEGYHLSAQDAETWKSEGGTELTLTDRNAHAWAEVYMTGLGWLPVEVVPGFYTETYSSQTIAGKPSYHLNPSVQEEGEMPDPTSAPGHFQEGGEKEEPDSLGIFTKFPLLLLFLLYLCVFLWIAMGVQRWFRMYLRKRSGIPKDAGERLMQYLALFEETFRLAGIREDFSRPEELWRKLHGQFPEVSEAEYDRGVELLQKAVFGGKDLYPHEWHTLQSLLEKLQTLLYRNSHFLKRKVLRDIYLYDLPDAR